MKFQKLTQGILLKRYKRFLADIKLSSGEIITAHVPNTGAMTSCIEDNCPVWVSFHDNPKRKLKYTLELSQMSNQLICTNTNHANKIVKEAIEENKILELTGYSKLKTEQKYGENSRIDILLENEKEKCFVEIKSVSLKLNNTFAFPDSVTSRGLKHLKELELMIKEGHRAVMLYLIQRTDTLPFEIAKDIDKKYYEAFIKAKEAGVEVLVYQSTITKEEIKIT